MRSVNGSEPDILPTASDSEINQLLVAVLAEVQSLSKKMEVLTAQVDDLRTQNKKLISENEVFREVLSAQELTLTETVNNDISGPRPGGAAWSEAASELEYVRLRETLGNSALLPYYDVLAACGISRDVGDNLREKGHLEPVVVKDSKNPRLYVTLGAWRSFVKKRKLAPPPSRSKLSLAKKRKKS